MGSSKKHKKHKEKKSDIEYVGSEIKPLKLVLKVPHTASFAATSSPSNSNGNESSLPKLVASYASTSYENNEPSTSSSMKKMKKKKSKKKHRKHSHHHSRHRHHHHRHRGSCSHHSRQSQDGQNTNLDSSIVSVGVTPTKSPQKSSSSSSSKSAGKTQFQHFLSHLLKQLQRKDVQQFFAWPVSDLIAPGYSSIISHPMDLSTMKQKIDQNLYETLLDFKSDIKLMCDNAMKYNRPETVYYKAANKLWHYSRAKLLNKDSLIEMARSYPGLSSYELGFNIEQNSFVENNTDYEMKVAALNGQEIAAPEIAVEPMIIDEERPELQEAQILEEDGLTPEQILEEAKKAAAAAAERLTLERPKGTNFSFLRQRNDGSTTLSILGNYQYEQTVNLEQLVGKLQEGTASLNSFVEHEINRVKPFESISEGPFGSYLPSLDSSKATLNEQDSALLLSAYGDDELGLQYAQSLTQYAQDADYVLHLVDSLLDVLTHGQHTKIATKLKEQKAQQNSNTNSNNIQTENEPEVADEIQEQLNEATGLIGQLETIQNQRLSSSTQTVKPSTEEENIANQLSSKLTDIISSCANPNDISDVNTIRKAMGITIKTEKQ